METKNILADHSQEMVKVSPTNLTTKLIYSLLGIRLIYGFLAAITLRWLPGVLVVVSFLYIYFTYLVTSWLIWRERNNLSDYHIGKFALILFIASAPYQAILAIFKLMPLTLPPVLIILPVFVLLFVALMKSKPINLTNPKGLLQWVLLGIGVGILGGIPAGWLISLQANHSSSTLTFLWVLLLPTVQISAAAVQEEPLFRGFLWGYLEKRGWTTLRILIVQALLFWIGHIYYLVSGDFYSFWVLPLASGLVFGWIAWKGKDIAPSMFAHGFFNSISQIVASLLGK